MKNKSVIVIGGGGHAKVVIDALLLSKVPLVGYTDVDDKELSLSEVKIPYLGEDAAVFKKYRPSEVSLVNGIGSVGLEPDGSPTARETIFEQFKSRGYEFIPIIHPSAIVSPDVVVGEGCQIMAGAVIQAGTRLGDNVIVNTRASVDHDCRIGSHSHIAPGAILSGGVELGSGSHIGTGAAVRQGLRLGLRVFVNMRSVVTADQKDFSVVTA